MIFIKGYLGTSDEKAAVVSSLIRRSFVMTYSKAIFQQVANLEIGGLILVRLSEQSENDWRRISLPRRTRVGHRLNPSPALL